MKGFTLLRVAAFFAALVVAGGIIFTATQSAATSAATASTAQAQAMTKRLITPGGRGGGGGLLSPGILVGNTLYLSGQLGTSGKADGVAGETKAAIASAEAILKAAEMELSDVVMITAFLVDAADYQPFNTAYREAFTTDPRPTRTTVFVKELVNGAKVELTMTAVKAR